MISLITILQFSLSKAEDWGWRDFFFLFYFFDRTCLCNAVTGNTIAKESIPTICTQRSLMKWYRWGPTQRTGLPTLNRVQMRWTGWFTQLGGSLNLLLAVSGRCGCFSRAISFLSQENKESTMLFKFKKGKVWVFDLWHSEDTSLHALQDAEAKHLLHIS